MITAHAPAGYIGAQLLRRLKPAQLSARAWSLYGAISGILPDVDMLWFYLVDHGHVHHHRYPTHWPLLWLLALICALLYWHKTRRPAAAIALLVAVNGMVHMFLDSIVGDIFWLMPWRDTPFSFFTVTARYQPWWLNFILHWSFLLELVLWVWAAALYLRQRRQAHER